MYDAAATMQSEAIIIMAIAVVEILAFGFVSKSFSPVYLRDIRVSIKSIYLYLRISYEYSVKWLWLCP